MVDVGKEAAAAAVRQEKRKLCEGLLAKKVFFLLTVWCVCEPNPVPFHRAGPEVLLIMGSGSGRRMRTRVIAVIVFKGFQKTAE